MGYGRAKDHCFGWTVFDPGYDVLAGETHRGRVEERLRLDIRLTSSKARAELARIGCASVRQVGANRF